MFGRGNSKDAHRDDTEVLEPAEGAPQGETSQVERRFVLEVRGRTVEHVRPLSRFTPRDEPK
jgi:hypothetical protein